MFDPWVVASGHSPFPEHWGRLLPRPVDKSVKTTLEPKTIRITFRLAPLIISHIDDAAKLRNFRSRTDFVHSLLVAYVPWRSLSPDTLVKESTIPRGVVSVASNFTISSGESRERP